MEIDYNAIPAYDNFEEWYADKVPDKAHDEDLKRAALSVYESSKALYKVQQSIKRDREIESLMTYYKAASKDELILILNGLLSPEDRRGFHND